MEELTIPACASQRLNADDLFLAYQRIQWKTLEKAITRGKYIASFVAQEPITATFAGLYSIGSWETLDHQGYESFPGNEELEDLGTTSRSPDMGDCLAFELERLDAYSEWVGRLVITWPKGASEPCRTIAVEPLKVRPSTFRSDSQVPSGGMIVDPCDLLARDECVGGCSDHGAGVRKHEATWHLPHAEIKRPSHNQIKSVGQSRPRLLLFRGHAELKEPSGRPCRPPLPGLAAAAATGGAAVSSVRSIA